MSQQDTDVTTFLPLPLPFRVRTDKVNLNVPPSPLSGGIKCLCYSTNTTITSSQNKVFPKILFQNLTVQASFALLALKLKKPNKLNLLETGKSEPNLTLKCLILMLFNFLVFSLFSTYSCSLKVTSSFQHSISQFRYTGVINITYN